MDIVFHKWETKKKTKKHRRELEAIFADRKKNILPHVSNQLWRQTK